MTSPQQIPTYPIGDIHQELIRAAKRELAIAMKALIHSLRRAILSVYLVSVDISRSIILQESTTKKAPMRDTS